MVSLKKTIKQQATINEIVNKKSKMKKQIKSYFFEKTNNVIQQIINYKKEKEQKY